VPAGDQGTTGFQKRTPADHFFSPKNDNIKESTAVWLADMLLGCVEPPFGR